MKDDGIPCLLIITTNGEKEYHYIPSKRQRSAFKAQHSEWHLNSTYQEEDILPEDIIKDIIKRNSL